MSAIAGKRVAVTRPIGQSEHLLALLRAEGAEPIEAPLISIKALKNSVDEDVFDGTHAAYDWIVFTSANAVRHYADCLNGHALPSGRVAAVGEATAEALRTLGWPVDLTPQSANNQALADALGDVAGASILHPCAQGAADLSVMLQRGGAHVRRVAVYRTLRVPGRPDLAGPIDAVLFTSSSAVSAWLESSLHEEHRDARVVCIGQATAEHAQARGLTVHGVARVASDAGMIAALCQVLTTETSNMFETNSAQGAGNSGLATATDPTPARARPRRLRGTPGLRSMVRETRLSPAELIYPIFVRHGVGVREPIESLPGVDRVSVDHAVREAEACVRLGIPAMLLFGLPAQKTELGEENYSDDGIVQRALRAIKRAAPDLVLITDVCMCQYTSSGHCGVLNTGSLRASHPGLTEGYVLNDETLALLSRVALSHARAGADIVAPSGMIDGMVGAIRSALDSGGFAETLVLSYSTKYASAMYGPFREAAGSALKSGDRRTHQMDPANVREALREAALDVAEGADMLMVKPALAYLDVIKQTREQFPQMPLAAYNVSGEYAMVKAAAERGWIDEQAVALEMLTAIKRAGADMIITYWAKDAARWLAGDAMRW